MGGQGPGSAGQVHGQAGQDMRVLSGAMSLRPAADVHVTRHVSVTYFAMSVRYVSVTCRTMSKTQILPCVCLCLMNVRTQFRMNSP
jgi:hypothetical protein